MLLVCEGPCDRQGTVKAFDAALAVEADRLGSNLDIGPRTRSSEVMEDLARKFVYTPHSFFGAKTLQPAHLVVEEFSCNVCGHVRRFGNG